MGEPALARGSALALVLALALVWAAEWVVALARGSALALVLALALVWAVVPRWELFQERPQVQEQKSARRWSLAHWERWLALHQSAPALELRLARTSRWKFPRCLGRNSTPWTPR